MENESHPLGINTLSQDNQVSNPFPTVDLLVKRRRGRPKKNPRLHLNRREKALEPRAPIQEGEDIAHSSPVYEPMERNGNSDRNLGNSSNDVLVGQSVNGVIEAKFDAGYLLSVTVGNSGTTLRGVVFKPGCVAPVSAENDIAPHLPMIRRKKLPFHKEKIRQHGNRNISPRASTELRFSDCFPQTAQNAASFGISRGKEIVPSTLTTHTTSPTISRGTLVPVLLQPVELPNGSGPLFSKPVQVASQPPHLSASRNKQLPDAAPVSTTAQVVNVGNQSFGALPQNAQQATSNGMQSNAAEVLVKAEARAINSPDRPFEKLLSEFIKKAEGSSKPVMAEATNLPGKDSSHNLQDNTPLSITPLQSVRPDQHAVTAFKPFEKIGRMTELLQAVQVNMRENQAAFGSRETEKDSVFSEKPSQA